jgi:hypothetical protein
MSTIERRVRELERAGTSKEQPLVMLLEGAEPDAAQAGAMREAERTGRLVIRVRFVRPERAAKEQRP